MLVLDHDSCQVERLAQKDAHYRGASVNLRATRSKALVDEMERHGSRETRLREQINLGVWAFDHQPARDLRRRPRDA